MSVGSRKDVQALLAAGRVVTEALARMRALVRPGATTAELDRAGHVTLQISSLGDTGDGQDVLVRVHSECLTGDVFGSLRCDCGTQLSSAIEGITGTF